VGIPCVCVACSLDAGTQMFGPEQTSKVYQDTFGQLEEFKKPMQTIAKAV
jgi:methyl-coenzyme M reductase beta subunit